MILRLYSWGDDIMIKAISHKNETINVTLLQNSTKKSYLKAGLSRLCQTA